MNTAELRAVLLGTINDLTTASPYGEGLLVGLPFTYSDGDTVRLLVEPHGGGLRVTDRAEALDRLVASGVLPEGRTASIAIAEVVQSAGLNRIGSLDDELASVVPISALGETLIEIGLAAVRIDQLRWLAQDRLRVRFSERVVTRLSALNGTRWTVHRSAQLKLRSGQDKQITAAVQGDSGVAYVQAVGHSDRERSVEHCYYLFELATVKASHKVSAMHGSRRDWPSDLTSTLGAVSSVAYYDEPNDLERIVTAIAGGTGVAQIPR